MRGSFSLHGRMLYFVPLENHPSFSMSLSESQKKYLRGLCHHRHAIVTVAGKGLTDSVQNEIERAVNDHELVKIKLRSGDREEKQRWTDEICSTHDALLIQKIGNMIAIYRANPKTRKIVLP